MVEAGMQAALLVVGLLFLVVVCALFQRRPRPDAYSHEELSQIRIDRELAKEVRRNKGERRRTLIILCERKVTQRNRDSGKMVK